MITINRVGFVAVIGVSFLFLLALLFLLAAYLIHGKVRTTRSEEALAPSKYDERILTLDKEALDSAYRNQIIHLFSVWMKDETGQPARAITGARQARKAYIGGMTEIEKRERK